MKIEASTEEEAFEKIAYNLAVEIMEKYKDLLIDYGHVDTGYMLNSIGIQKTPTGFKIHIGADYATAFEYGEKDPTVKWYDIQEWLRRKYGISNKKELNAKTSVITKRIREEGQYPKYLLEKAIYSVIDKYS